MLRALTIAIFCLFILAKPAAAFAGDFIEDTTGTAPQGDMGDSNLDPFADYHEFEEDEQQEADENFFHNGRFFSVGIMGGYESFTQTLGLLYTSSIIYGGYLTYFFDLRFALQVSYQSANHPLNINTGGSVYTGTVSLQHIALDFKYYMHTQNVTRGLANLNPYVILGVSNYYRTTSYNGTAGIVRDGAFGIEGGGGLEIPMMHNKAYFGLQATYNYIGFGDRGSPITINGVAQNIEPTGDALDFIGFIGINF